MRKKTKTKKTSSGIDTRKFFRAEWARHREPRYRSIRGETRSKAARVITGRRSRWAERGQTSPVSASGLAVHSDSSLAAGCHRYIMIYTILSPLSPEHTRCINDNGMDGCTLCNSGEMLIDGNCRLSLVLCVSVCAALRNQTEQLWKFIFGCFAFFSFFFKLYLTFYLALC